MLGHRRSIFIPVGLLAVLAALTVYLAFSHSVASRQNQYWLIHTYRVLDANQRMFVSMQDAEAAARAYMLTGDASYERQFRTAVATTGDRLAETQQLVADSPRQLTRVAQMRTAVAARMATLQAGLDMARAGQHEAAVELIHAGRSGDQAGPVRALARDIANDERQLLIVRNNAANREEQRGYIIAGGLSLVVLAALGWAIVVLVRANSSLTQQVRRREAAEAAQAESDVLIRTVFENAPEYLLLIDVLEDRFVVADVNPAFEQAVRQPASFFRGRDVRDVFGAAGQSAHESYLRVLAENQTVSITDTIRDLGPPMIWDIRNAPVRDPSGRIVRLVVSVRDVTERDAMEEQLRRAQRMDAIGQLTGGVAHDFNNLLQVIHANLEMIEPALADAPQARKRLRNAIHGADRAAQLTSQMLAFARRQPLEPRVVNLGRLVGDMAEMMRRTLGEAVEVETVIAGGLWNTVADPAQVESAVLNLAINARDAMPGGGRLTIELANASLDDAYALRDHDIAAGQYVMLAVSDTGEGMPPEVAARVFEPFFTTKTEGRGTGLGLSMVYGFVKQSNGHVQIYSEPGSGTTVKIYLPRSRKAEELPADHLEALPAGGDQVVLVVEDDGAVRAAAVGMLEELGYQCLQAAGAQEGLEIVRSGARIDLLFTDVIMPGPLKTRDFVAQVETLRPNLPVLYTSGYTENAIVHHGRLDEGITLLSKPYRRGDLARKVGQLLSAARPTVLVVEDDALVRSAAIDMISELGFAVVAVGDAPSALAHLRSGGRVDLLFTDIGLPGMRGPALAAAARQIRPDLRVAFASGYGETEETAAVSGATYLTKPYHRQHLAKMLKGLE